MTNKQKIKCLFGYHDYKIPHKNNPFVLLCKHCKRFGYYLSPMTKKVWFEFDKEGNMIHRKHSNGYEAWYDGNGGIIKEIDERGVCKKDSY